MLDRASLDRLSRTPEKNAPMLNVALAEEGPAPVLLALARSPAVGPEAIEAIAARVEREGEEVGRDADAGEEFQPIAAELDRRLVAHPNASAAVLAAVVARHAGEAFFVLAGACHPHAPLAAIERAVDWPAASPVHDRLWVALLDPASVPTLVLEEWAQDPAPLRREAAARIARDPGLLAALARDRSRQVRRAVASNRFAAEERARIAAEDPAPEVRVRAAGALTAHGELPAPEASITETARFAAALRAMATGGVLAPDVTRALSGGAGELDPEGALWAARVLPRAELATLVDATIGGGRRDPQAESPDQHLRSPAAMGLAAGLSLRPLVPPGHEESGEDEAELAEVIYEAVKSLSRTTTAESRLTGKARLSAWTAEALATAGCVDRAELLDDLGRRPIAADRMVLARAAALRGSLVPELCAGAREAAIVPASLLELAWADPRVPDELALEMAARIPRPKKRAEDLPEDEVDLDPSLRSLELLERVVLTATQRANLSPRAALAVVALDARRVRYILSAMPQWKGRLTGGRLARVLRQHAGALSAAHAEARARVARVEAWTHRALSELELSIALAVGHLTGKEVAARIASGRQPVQDGLTLASGVEARAAIEGTASVEALLSWAAGHRGTLPVALAMWLLLERLDRERAPTLVASAMDGIAAAGKGVPASVCDALALLEHRRPGRLETIHPQSPRGRATLASAIARAYRGIGGMRDERQGP